MIKENYFDFLSEDTLKKLAELKKIMGKDFEEKIENGILDFIEIQKEMYTMIE